MLAGNIAPIFFGLAHNTVDPSFNRRVPIIPKRREHESGAPQREFPLFQKKSRTKEF
jgi:hypothetical protein